MRRKQSGASSAQAVEAQDEEAEGEHVLEENKASDDELEAESQEAVAVMTIAKQRKAEVDRARQIFRKPQSSEERKARLDKLKQKFPCERCGQLGHWKDDGYCPAKVKARALNEGLCVTPETVEVTKEDCSSKFVGELCTVSCVSGYSNSVDLPQIFLCESSECLLHIFGPENFTSVADVCSYVPNWTTPLSAIAATCSCGQPGARRAMYSGSEIPSKRSLASQMVLCQEHSLSASFCHVQRVFTVRMRKVAWFHVRAAVPW